MLFYMKYAAEIAAESCCEECWQFDCYQMHLVWWGILCKILCRLHVLHYQTSHAWNIPFGWWTSDEAFYVKYFAGYMYYITKHSCMKHPLWLMNIWWAFHIKCFAGFIAKASHVWNVPFSRRGQVHQPRTLQQPWFPWRWTASSWWPFPLLWQRIRGWQR